MSQGKDNAGDDRPADGPRQEGQQDHFIQAKRQATLLIVQETDIAPL